MLFVSSARSCSLSGNGGNGSNSSRGSNSSSSSSSSKGGGAAEAAAATTAALHRRSTMHPSGPRAPPSCSSTFEEGGSGCVRRPHPIIWAPLRIYLHVGGTNSCRSLSNASRGTKHKSSFAFVIPINNFTKFTEILILNKDNQKILIGFL